MLMSDVSFVLQKEKSKKREEKTSAYRRIGVDEGRLELVKGLDEVNPR